MRGDVKKYLPTAVVAVLCLAGFFLPECGVGHDQPWQHALLFHFSHANVFHLAGNLWFLVWFHPRWSTLAVSYVVATLAALLPISWVAAPTVGLSALLFAAVARSYVTWHSSVWKLLAVNMAVGLLPMINGRMHVASFLAAYTVWKLISLQRKR